MDILRPLGLTWPGAASFAFLIALSSSAVTPLAPLSDKRRDEPCPRRRVTRARVWCLCCLPVSHFLSLLSTCDPLTYCRAATQARSQFDQPLAGAAKAAKEGELKGAAAAAHEKHELKGAAAATARGERMGAT